MLSALVINSHIINKHSLLQNRTRGPACKSEFIKHCFFELNFIQFHRDEIIYCHRDEATVSLKNHTHAHKAD